MRIEHLVESRPRVLSMSNEEARDLMTLGQRLASKSTWWGEADSDEPRSVLSCRLTASGQWQLRVDNCVGVIVVPDLQIIIKPKIPTSHLLFLFEASGQLPRVDTGAASIAEDDSLWVLMATWYVSHAERLLRLGLVRDYVRINDIAPTVRGSLDVRRTSRAFYQGRLELHCRFDEFEEDTPLNRVIRSALRVVAASSVLSPDLRKRATRGLRRLDHIGPAAPSDLNAILERRSAHYATAFSLARNILLSIGRGLEAGAGRGWSFLIRTPEMVEAGIRTLLQTSFPGPIVQKQGIRLEGSSLTMTPDLVVFGGKAVADVKYKLTDSDWPRADLYQIVAFATAFNVREAAVIAFTPPDGNAPSNVSVGSVTVTPLSWPASPELSAETACGFFVRTFETWLRRSVELKMPA